MRNALQTLILILVFFILGCDSVKKKYHHFSDISENDGVKSWLPDFFPKDSVDIVFTSNLDLNFFRVYFSSPEDNFLNFREKHDISPKGLTFIKEQNEVISYGICKYSDKNIFGEKVNGYFIIGAVNKKDRYYIISISIEQYKEFCQQVGKVN